jgi:transposase-like protein
MAQKNKLTNEQIEKLRESGYVRGVNENYVYFTDEFKQMYWQMYTSGNLMPHEILRRLGLDYSLLGSSRVRGLAYSLRKQYERDGGFCTKRCGRKPKQRVEQASEQNLERLRVENEYLKQELDFVKKIVAAGGEVKR